MIRDARSEMEALDAGWEEDDEGEAPGPSLHEGLDELDAGWDLEEARAVAEDVASGLDPEARRAAAEARARERRERLRAKKLAARDKRRAKADSIRQKQKKPKRRSHVPPLPVRREEPAAAASSADAAPLGADAPKATARVARRSGARLALLVVAGLVALGLVAVAWTRLGARP